MYIVHVRVQVLVHMYVHVQVHVVADVIVSSCDCVLVWAYARTNAESLLRAHEQRCGISSQMRDHTDPNLSKTAINGGDNASVNFKQNRLMHAKCLPGFENFEIGCRIHATALIKNRMTQHLLTQLIRGQIHWSLVLNKGQRMCRYRACVKKVATEWIHILRGQLDFANRRQQRQLMQLIFQPHSYVCRLDL